MKLTEHFTFEELTTTNNNSLLKKNRDIAKIYMYKLFNLALFCEQIRKIIGNKPMTITSGFRCKALNTAVGGSKTSQHILCQAIDFIPKGIDLLAAFKLIDDSDLPFGQLIYEKSKNGDWIHISMENEKHKRECFALNAGVQI